MQLLPAVSTPDGARSAARYEYRVFRRDLRWVRQRLRDEMRRDGSDASEDLYLLGSRLDRSVKVRDGMLELKKLVGTHGALERWDFVGRVSFPLHDDWVSGLLAENLGAESLRAPHEQCSLPSLLRDVIGREPSVCAIEVAKRRERFATGPLLAEFTRLRADGAATDTVAVEGANARAVEDWVRRLELDRRRNTSYVRWLMGFAAACGEAVEGPE